MTQKPALPQIIGAVIQQRCPRCLKGPIFKSTWDIHERCSTCQLVFEREPGYFTGAMYLSYGMSILVVFPIWLMLLFWEFTLITIVVTIIAILLILTPFLFRYSRIVWMHIDQAISPR